MNSVDLSRLRNHLDTLHEEFMEASYLLSLLNKMQTQDELTGGINRRLIADQISVITKQKEYIINRKTVLETLIKRYKWTKQSVSDDLDDAIQQLLHSF